jgi:uncharacterized membrane protein YkoI
MRTKKPIVAVALTAAVVSLAGAGYALGGGGGVIWDDGHAAKPGSLDDGKQLLPKTTVSLAAAVAGAQRAARGALGQVDLVERDGRVLYVVDVGDREVSVDARTGAIAGIGPQS